MGREEFKGISQHTISYEASKDLILVHTVQLIMMIKAHPSGIMVFSGISDAVIASVHPEKTRQKKWLLLLLL